MGIEFYTFQIENKVKLNFHEVHEIVQDVIWSQKQMKNATHATFISSM